MFYNVSDVFMVDFVCIGNRVKAAVVDLLFDNH